MVKKITYNRGNDRPLLPPILVRSPDYSSKYEKFLRTRSKWLPMHIRIAVMQIDSDEMKVQVRKIQRVFRKYNYNRKMSIGRIFKKRHLYSNISSQITSYLNINKPMKRYE